MNDNNNNNIYIGACERCGASSMLIPIVDGHNGFDPEDWGTDVCTWCYDNLVEEHQESSLEPAGW